MMWIVLVAGVVALWLLYWGLSQNETDRLLASVPGPRRLPILGNIYEYLGLDQAEIFRKTRGFAARFGDRYRLKVFNRRILNILHPDDAEIVLTSARNIKKSFLYSFLRSWLQEGLLLSDGAKWHARRKILTPAFHFNILKEFSGVIEENSWELVRELTAEGGASTNITPLVSKFALHSICETAMGTQLDADKSNTALEYKSAIMKVGHMFLERLTKFWQHSDWIYRRTSDGKKYERLLKIIHSFPEKVIQERRKSRLHNSGGNKSGQDFSQDEEVKEDDVYMNPKKRLAMLDLLLDAESRNEIDMNGIKEEVDTFMFEGHDTTAMAITHTLMLLANHESVQERVFEECERVFGGGGRAASMAELGELRYLEACIKETLRLYPSVPFISRTLSEDIQLRDAVVKAGTTCHVHIYDLHRRADLFPQPTQFLPERFLAGTLQADRHPFAYIPFSAGPRNCIGQRFAMLEMKSVVSAVVRSYRLRAVTRPEHLVFLADLVLRPRDPVYVRFEKR